MNSFKGVRDALSFEIERQTSLLERGEKVVQETRLWDAESLQTITMRTKEEAQDYRYFPEPDLPPFIIQEEKIKALRKEIPELPKEKLARFVKDYGLSEYDARILIISKKDADYAQNCLEKYPGKDKKQVANWLIGPLLSEANARNLCIADLNLSFGYLLELIQLVENETISNLTAKIVLKEMLDKGLSASEIVKRDNLAQISDLSSLENAADEIIKNNPKSVQDFKAGKANALMFLVGQVMKKTQGKANPKLVQDILKRRLSHA
jgi:aspartyl-tRNA(Asn)/glutamyl-tRNA(Gln) amidotransferase subunit B